MRLLLSYLLTPVYHIYFGLLLLIFHPVQEMSRLAFGDSARKKSVEILNLLLIKGLYILGCPVKFIGFEKVPHNRPIVIVSNHQSMYDIPAVVWGFRRNYPKFISKIELGRNLPSISINLKYGKSALIDRKNGSQSVKEILKLGKLIEAHNYAACIFPEGTRSKTGQVKKFMTAGLSTLLRAAPTAIIVPFVIDGHCELMSKGLFPLRFGQRITYTVLDAVEPKDRNIDELAEQIRNTIQAELNREK